MSYDTISRKARISLFLLLIISVRLIPFSLLHYHNKYFASIERHNSVIDDFEASIGLINNAVEYCTFDKFLSLTNGAFVLDISHQALCHTDNGIGIRTEIEIKVNDLFFDILNKGSPILI